MLSFNLVILRILSQRCKRQFGNVALLHRCQTFSIIGDVEQQYSYPAIASTEFHTTIYECLRLYPLKPTTKCILWCKAKNPPLSSNHGFVGSNPGHRKCFLCRFCWRYYVFGNPPLPQNVLVKKLAVIIVTCRGQGSYWYRLQENWTGTMLADI